MTLVNKWNPLPDNYAITLVEVPGGEKVDERIYGPLMEMLEAAKEENWDQLPKVVSGYRTQETQQKLYDDKIAEYKQQGYSENEAVEQAEQWVAVPGYSEHQLGIAVDINGATYRYLINNANFASYIKIVKKDAETGNTIPYAGAGFQIYDPNGELVTMTYTYPEVTTSGRMVALSHPQVISSFSIGKAMA